MKKPVNIGDISRRDAEPITQLEKSELKPLPGGLGAGDGPAFAPLSDQLKARCECGLDGTCALNLPKPKSREEEEALVKSVSLRSRKVIQQGKQLDVSAAAATHHGALHALPDLLRRLPHL